MRLHRNKEKSLFIFLLQRYHGLSFGPKAANVPEKASPLATVFVLRC